MTTKKPAHDSSKSEVEIASPVEPSQPVADKSSSKTSHTWWWVLGLGGLVLVLVVALVTAAYFYLPLWLVKTAVGKFDTYESFHAGYTSPVDDQDVKVTVDADILSDGEKLSKITVDIPKLELDEETTASLKTDIVINDKDVYIRALFSGIGELEKALVDLPIITETETYRLALPVIKGESYLHMEIPQETEEEKKESDKDSSTEISEADQKKLSKSWGQVYKVRSFNPFYFHEGKRYTKITFGVRKNKLLQAIEDLKDTDLDLKVSQINAMKKMVESTDGWDSDLVEVVIDTDNNVRTITARIPQVPEDVLSKNLADTMANQDSMAAMVKQVTTQAEKLITQHAKENKLAFVELGSIQFDKFNTLQPANKPDKVVEAKKLLEVGQTELAPVIGALLSGQALPTPPPAPKKMAPVVKTPVQTQFQAADCFDYQILDGPFASKKCYSQADMNRLSQVMKERNDYISRTEATFTDAQNKCASGDQGACSQAETIYNQAHSQVQAYEQEIKTIVSRGW